MNTLDRYLIDFFGFKEVDLPGLQNESFFQLLAQSDQPIQDLQWLMRERLVPQLDCTPAQVMRMTVTEAQWVLEEQRREKVS